MTASVPRAGSSARTRGGICIACTPEDCDRLLVLALEAGVPAKVVGEVGGDAVRLGPATIGLETLRNAHEGALPQLLD